jgi:hypothetical protein
MTTSTMTTPTTPTTTTLLSIVPTEKFRGRRYRASMKEERPILICFTYRTFLSSKEDDEGDDGDDGDDDGDDDDDDGDGADDGDDDDDGDGDGDVKHKKNDTLSFARRNDVVRQQR